KNHIVDHCSECQSTSLFEDAVRGEIICGQCGLVVGPLMKSDADWRAYSPFTDNVKERVGAPLSPLQPSFGLSTDFVDARKDSQGKYLSPEKQQKYRRLSRVHGRTEQPVLRNLRSALRELKRISSHLGLSDVVAEEAARIYRMALKEKLIRGHSIDGIVAASIYLSCRRKETPITFKEVSSLANVTQKEFGRCVRLLLTRLNLRNPLSDYRGLIFRLGADLDLSIPTRRRATEIVDAAKKKGVTVGKNPMSIAAAAIYIAAIQKGERRTQQQIAIAARTTPVTIRHRFKELVAILEIDKLDVKRGAAAAPVYISDPEAIISE
ncbi:MAG: transcription initiation factor IIB family protein, partial [Promethearchaeota archaeon]